MLLCVACLMDRRWWTSSLQGTRCCWCVVLLVCESTLFSSLFELAPGSNASLGRTLQDSPIDINRAEPSITASDFRAFARALTSPVYALHFPASTFI